MDIYQNGTRSESGFRNSFSTEPLWNQSLKILQSHSPLPLSVFVQTRVKAELRSAYHKKWYLKFCQKISSLFFGFFTSLFSLHKVYNVTSCCLYTPIVMTTVRDSWLWLAAQEEKVTERSWGWRFEINYTRKCRWRSYDSLSFSSAFITV